MHEIGFTQNELLWVLKKYISLYLSLKLILAILNNKLFAPVFAVNIQEAIFKENKSNSSI